MLTGLQGWCAFEVNRQISMFDPVLISLSNQDVKGVAAQYDVFRSKDITLSFGLNTVGILDLQLYRKLQCNRNHI